MFFNFATTQILKIETQLVSTQRCCFGMLDKVMV